MIRTGLVWRSLIVFKSGIQALPAVRFGQLQIDAACRLLTVRHCVGDVGCAGYEVSGTERLFPACTTPIQEGMSVTTNSPKLTRYRRISVELLLIERNHVCAVCVSNGHCELQSMATALGISTVEFAYNFPKLSIDVSHPRFVLDHNRCILCTR